MASCWDPTIQVHCIVLGVILSSGHKHADLFPSLPKGRNHLPYHIWNRLIFHVPLLRNRNNCWLELSGSDAGVGFCRAPLPPLGGIMTSPGAQHPFGAFSNRTICARPIPFVDGVAEVSSLLARAKMVINLFRQAHIYYFRDKCVVFVHDCKS